MTNLINPLTGEINPDGLLDQIRHRIKSYKVQGNWSLRSLVELFEELDEHLTAGGELPSDWRGENLIEHIQEVEKHVRTS